MVIGRNEGERLKACLESIRRSGSLIVYVDSGSTDDSVEYASRLELPVVKLDMEIPFTAARARNAGFNRLCQLHPDTEFVQFLDGDCILSPDWLQTGIDFLASETSFAAVCGRVREVDRDGSIYNRLLDLEWDTLIGETKACGGIAILRRAAFDQVGGFNAMVIAGEEPEMCVRLRQLGWRIMRLDAEMTKHDADMHRFGQWWKRAKRAGHAYAEGAAIHGRGPFQHKVREVRSALFWGGLIPLFAIVCLLLSGLHLSMLLGLIAVSIAYSVLCVKIYRSSRQRCWSAEDSWLFSFFCVLSKVPCCFGIMQYWFNRWCGAQSKLIEYKQS